MNIPVSPQQVRTTPFSLPAPGGESLACDARVADGSGVCPTVIFIHGFKGFKEWGSIPYICNALARRGFYVLSFNFSHNGIEGNSQEFTQLERFARNTFSREVAELRAVVDAVAAGNLPDPERSSRDRIGILGHSRGGGISILEAGSDPRVRAVAVWGAVSDFNRYTDRQKELWRTNGVFETKNMRTGQIMPLGIGLLNDLEENAESLNIGSAVARLARPLLILHGEQDLSVRVEEGERLAALADPSHTDFERIPRTGHTFGAVHPFEGTNDILEHAIARTAMFFTNNLA